MSDAVLVASVAAATSLAVASIGPWVSRGVESSRDRREATLDVNLRHLAPLRQQLAETTVRNQEILRRAQHHDLADLAVLDDPDDLEHHPLEWFAGEGCYLMSTTYLTACLFAEFRRLQGAYPFLRLRDDDRDSELAALVLRIRLAFSGVDGVFYVVQDAIGADMLGRDGHVATYPAFVRAVRDPERRTWYRQLMQFYRHLAAGDGTSRLEDALSAMHSLASLLDAVVGGAASITSRLGAEVEVRVRRAAAPSSPPA